MAGDCALNKVPKVKMVREELFRAPRLPAGQDICDLFTFEIGKATFLLITTLCQDRTQAGLNRLFRLSHQSFDPEPILTLEMHHPRNVALGPESSQGRWLWIADHGLDAPPFPGGHCSLYWISESGAVEEKTDPLLEALAFSFDGCIWEDPKARHTYLYQSNIGSVSPRLFRWKNRGDELEDLSTALPQNLLSRKDRYLVSRLLEVDSEAAYLFLGGDYSCPSQTPLATDAIMKIPFDGPVQLNMEATPPRMRANTWSTVEALTFDQGPEKALLTITHDFGFKEGFAEILVLQNNQRLKRHRHALPLPSLAGKETWISRAAIGDWDKDGQKDFVFYLRASAGSFNDSLNNLFLLRQHTNGPMEFIECVDRGFSSHFVGGFFVENELFQLRYDGVCEHTRFVPAEL